MGKTLKQLFHNHKGKMSDKWSLYLDEWDRLFKPYRNQQIKLLEIGIQNGGSLEVWSKYFTKAKKIVGCDIDRNCERLRYDDTRITVIVGDANLDDCESEILQQAPMFDIILDDGSHISSDIVRSFARYFPHLNDGGIYVVEDLHSSYWDNFEGGLNNPLSAMSFFKRLTDVLNNEHWRNNRSRGSLLTKFAAEFGIKFDESDLTRIHSIEFVNSLCLIRKLPPDKNVLGKRIIVGTGEEVTTGWNKLNGTTIQDFETDIKDDESFDVFELITQNNSLTQLVSEREQVIQNLTKQPAEKGQVIQSLTAQVAEKERSVQALSAQVAEQEQSVQALSAQVVEKEHTVQALSALVAERAVLVQSMKVQAAKRDKLAQSLISLVAKRDKLVQSMTAQAAERDALVQSMNAQAAERDALVQSMTAQAAEQELKNRSLNNKISQSQEEVIFITKSMSWRITRPLRNIMRVLKNMRSYIAIWRSGLFDKKYYLQNYPDVRKSDVDPLMHFIKYGWKEGRNPSKSFDTNYYLNLYSDVRDAKVNPLEHFILFGANEGRSCISEEKKANHIIRNYGRKEFFNRLKNAINYKRVNNIARNEKIDNLNLFRDIYEQLIPVSTNKKSSSYVDYVQNETLDFEHNIRLIAFYLPQFYPIAENDQAWGKGFTEWMNVTKAVPQFAGHYQPHLPGELGFYDLRIPEVQERQVELAKNYGIYGFCFYYYWFNGKRLLDKPLDQFISNPKIDFPFCICWANENWTKKWDGMNDEIIIGQKHSNIEDHKFMEDVIPLFRDNRYIRINNRPLLIVYNVKIMGNPSELLQYWRKISINSGVGDPFIVAAQTFEFYDPRHFGFDAAVMFPPHNVMNVPDLKNRIELANKDYDGWIFSYPDLVKEIVKRYKKEPFVHFKAVVPGWDNEPRRPGKGFTLINSTPEVYEYWLMETCRFTQKNNSINEQYVFINAWNEWAEGAHLEPDRKFGYGYLQATKNALINCVLQDPNISDGLTGNENQIIKVGSESIKKYKQIYLEIQEENEGKSKEKELIELYSGDPNPNPEVSIIIPVHNHFNDTFNCLQSLSRANEKTSFEVIMIDDCSNDETARVVSSCKGLRYLRNEKNIGFLNSCNFAANHAKGSYLIFLNNDTVVLPGWLDSLVETFIDNTDIGLVGSKLIFPNGTLQEAGGVVWKDGSAMNYGRGDDPDKPEYNYLREVDYCSGASIIIPTSLWKKLNGFDHLYQPAFYEDTDMAYRVRKAGYKVLYQPLSQVFHVEGATSGTDLSTGIKRFQEINREKFYKRWRKALESHGDISQPEFIYRNRFRNKRVLVIDVCTPKPDQDSGSIDTYNYLLSLRKIGFEVTFISVVDSNKVDRYVFDLLRKGVSCQYTPYLTSIEEYIKKFGYSFDVVFLFRASFGGKYIDIVKTYAPRAKIVFNTVDLHFLRGQREKAISTDDNGISQLEGISRDDELSIMRKADRTILVSDYEKGLMDEIDPEIKASVISLPREIPGRTNGFGGRKDILFIGGFFHRPNVDAVINFIDKIWPLIKVEIPDCRFYIIGSNIPYEIKALEDERIVVVGFVQELGEYFTKVKLSVSPLRFGAGVKGKILTSLSYGVPCVASPIAAEGMGLVDNSNILIGNSEKEFADAVFKLYNTEELWELLSQNGLSYVKNQHSIEQFENHLDKLITSLDIIGST